MVAPEGSADNKVPDASKMDHEKVVELMKKDAARQEPLVSVIATMLEETVMRNDLIKKRSSVSLSSFHGRKPPLSASAFVTRVAKYSGASPCCFAVGLIYLERMKKREPGVVCLNSGNFQRLFLVAVMAASKFLDDFYYSNKHWAEVWTHPLFYFSLFQYLTIKFAGGGNQNARAQQVGA